MGRRLRAPMCVRRYTRGSLTHWHQEEDKEELQRKNLGSSSGGAPHRRVEAQEKESKFDYKEEFDPGSG